MRYVAFATDYDGTLAEEGRVDPQTAEALAHLKASGRKLLLVTGRELEDLLRVFPRTGELFDIVVAENGALLYETARRTTQRLAEPPPPELRARLEARGVAPLSAGQVILATREPYEADVLDEIRALGLELQVIFNKGAVMVLPSGVNKGTGLEAALDVLGLSPHNVVAIGDAENDHALLATAECGVAVADALPMLRERADLVMKGKAGAGVRELIEALLQDDLWSRTRALPRHKILLEGQLGPDRSFYFRGPRGQLNLRAQNLILFNQIADGVDNETWLHHLRRGDYSRWFREGIKDPALAAEAETVERDRSLSARESRERIRSLIETRYGLPAANPAP
jgi:HAD superfamily hydrolase (TIGR01484 family)